MSPLPRQTPPGQTCPPPPGGHPTWADIPVRHPQAQRRPLQRTVHIIMECILVVKCNAYLATKAMRLAIHLKIKSAISRKKKFKKNPGLDLLLQILVSSVRYYLPIKSQGLPFVFVLQLFYGCGINVHVTSLLPSELIRVLSFSYSIT